MKKREVINYIEEAFDGVDAPRNITLHVAEAHDMYDYHNNQAHKKNDFIGPWQKAPSEHIKLSQCALSYIEA